MKSLIVTMAIALSATPLQAASGNQAVDDFVARLNGAIGGLKVGDRAAAAAACATLVERVFDIDAVAPATAPEAWKRMSASQRAAYSAGIASKAADDCAERSREFAGQALEFVGVRQGEGGDLLVATKGRSRTLIWRVRGSARLRAIDVSANGRSMVVAAQRNAQAVLQRTGGDLQALIESVAP